MTAVLVTLLVIVGAVVLGAAAFAGAAAYGLWSWSHATRRRVLVNLVDGSAVEGVLLHRRGQLLTVADGTLLTPDGRSDDLAGHAVLERNRVLFLQVLTPTVALEVPGLIRGPLRSLRSEAA